eukprot:1368155-Lingulodinium_polyedra.AAC.1
MAFEDEAERHAKTCATRSGHSHASPFPWATQLFPVQCTTIRKRTRVMRRLSCFTRLSIPPGKP